LEKQIDLYRLGGLLHHYRPRDILQKIVLLSIYKFILFIYFIIYTQLFENLKGRILKRIITWSEMGQQTAQSKKVYFQSLLQNSERSGNQSGMSFSSWMNLLFDK